MPQTEARPLVRRLAIGLTVTAMAVIAAAGLVLALHARPDQAPREASVQRHPVRLRARPGRYLGRCWRPTDPCGSATNA